MNSQGDNDCLGEPEPRIGGLTQLRQWRRLYFPNHPVYINRYMMPNTRTWMTMKRPEGRPPQTLQLTNIHSPGVMTRTRSSTIPLILPLQDQNFTCEDQPVMSIMGSSPLGMPTHTLPVGMNDVHSCSTLFGQELVRRNPRLRNEMMRRPPGSLKPS